MIECRFPFDGIELNKDTKIFLDACFLLTFLDHKDDRNSDCLNTFEKLIKNKCKLFVSNVVMGETLNILMNRYFVADICYRFNEYLLNSMDDINKLISFFNYDDQKIIKYGLERQLQKLNYRSVFNYIYKKTNAKGLLHIYLLEAVETYNALIDSLKFQCLVSNANMTNYAKELLEECFIDINDAQHYAVAFGHRMDYILTLDGDFRNIDSDKIKIMKINNGIELENTGTDN